MTRYRRNFVPGGTFFFTVNLADRRLCLLVEHIELLRAAFRLVRARHAFTMPAVVVLPDHLHAIWSMPEGDADYATRWQLIKAAFSRAVPRGEFISSSRAGKGERGIWQRRYWEHTIRDEEDFARHLDYIHINPVKHGFVTRVGEWKHSSFHQFVREGVYPADWAGDTSQQGGEFGERG
jgi:putative transposase